MRCSRNHWLYFMVDIRIESTTWIPVHSLITNVYAFDSFVHTDYNCCHFPNKKKTATVLFKIPHIALPQYCDMIKKLCDIPFNIQKSSNETGKQKKLDGNVHLKSRFLHYPNEIKLQFSFKTNVRQGYIPNKLAYFISSTK